MLQQQVHLLTTVLMIVDALAVIAAGYSALLFRYWESDGLWNMESGLALGSIMLVMFVNNYTLGLFGLYSDRRPRSSSWLLWSIFKATAVSCGVLSLGIFLFQEKGYSRLYFIAFALLTFGFVSLFRVLAQLYLERVAHNNPYRRRILVVGNSHRGSIVVDLLEQQLSMGHEVAGHVSLGPDSTGEGTTISSCEDLEKIIRETPLDEVVFAIEGDRALDLSQYVGLCKKTGLSFRILPSMWHPGRCDFTIESCQGVPFLTFQSTSFSATSLVYKRLLDILGGLVGCLIFIAIYPIIAAAIKFDSPGPVIFRQKRVGMHGRVFDLWKFRTMYRDAEGRLKELMAKNEMKGAMFKLKNDPRITTVGRWLRKTSIDEIPQFWNVLKGEMSLVGTRPPTLNEVLTYKTDHLKRIAAKPGITGMWQVSGRNKITDFETVVELDCRYMENWSLSTDLKILFKTFLVVLQRKGAV